MSEKLLEMIKRHEGVEKHCYRCSAGYLTIGVGRNVDPEDGLGLTDDEVDYLLNNDIVRVVKELGGEYRWFTDLNDARRDAMIDICFNLGATRLRLFKNALSAMSEEDYDTAADEFLNSRWAEQVKGRATELAEMIRTGEY